jgi:hypothetical protein
MTAAWKADAERMLMAAGSPPVLTTAMLHTMATAGRAHSPSPATFARWLASLVAGGKLRQVIKGVYLNVLGHRDASPAQAAYLVRSRSVVSLSWVLEQAGITNNFGDTVTCIIPTDPSWPNPNIGDRQTAAAPFRFFAMHNDLVEAGRQEDIRDMRFNYPRTTPEKAFADWLYLGASPRSRMTRPPFDLDVGSLNMPRVRRVARAMQITQVLDDWMQQYEAFQADEDVRENSATRMRF